MLSSGGACEASDTPHSPQNFTEGGFDVPHEGHVCNSALPHSPQNFRPDSFSAPHAEHVTAVTRVTFSDPREEARYPRPMSAELKPAQAADREAALRADEADALARAWWRRVPLVVTSPRRVFEALRETDELDVGARSEPVLAITILAGIAGVLLAPAWGTIMDDGTVDRVVLVVVTFVAGLFYGAAGYFLLGLVVWLGAKAVGVEAPFRIARQLVGFAALPMAISLVVVVPVIAIAFGEDWFRTGGSDEGAGETVVVAVGLAFVVWALALVAVGLRTTFRLPWQGVAGALGLAAVIVAALAVLPTL